MVQNRQKVKAFENTNGGIVFFIHSIHFLTDFTHLRKNWFEKVPKSKGVNLTFWRFWTIFDILNKVPRKLLWVLNSVFCWWWASFQWLGWDVKFSKQLTLKKVPKTFWQKVMGLTLTFWQFSTIFDILKKCQESFFRS